MVEIFSRGDGPRPQDVRLKAFLDQNRSTITQLADRLTQGQYSESKKPKPVPQPSGKTIVHALGGLASGSAAEPRPCARATVNGRVVVVDDNSGRQLHLVGQIERRGEAIEFRLASAENGYVSPLAPELLETLDDLDRAQLSPDGGEEALVQEIASRLGIE
jgi:hypothetical protein